MLTICPMRRATSSTRSVMITKSLVPRISWACCASCTLMAPSSLSCTCFGESIATARHGLKGRSTPSSRPPRNQLLDFLYGEWGDNAEKFAQYNLQPPRTWPELLTVARTFYEKEQIGRVLFTGVGGAPTTTQLYEWIAAAGGDPFDFAHPGTVDTFRFLAALRPYLSSESRRAKWNTTNEALAQDVAYLAQN